MVPLGLENRESIFQSGNFTQILENQKKYWEIEKKYTGKIGGNLSASNSEIKKLYQVVENYKNTGKVREICQAEKWEPLTWKMSIFSKINVKFVQ